MLKAYKTEINPSFEQRQIINQTIGTCRWIYNKFIEVNKNLYEKEKTYMSGYTFSKWMNNEYIPQNPDKHWIKQGASKAVKQSIMNAHKAFNPFSKINRVIQNSKRNPASAATI